MSSENNMERRLNTFIQVSKNITTNDSLKELIQQIIEDVIGAIEKADAGFLLLWNEENQYLEIEAAVNFKEDIYLENKLLEGEGISGTVFAEGRSMLINTIEEIEKAMSNMRNKTLQYYLKSTVHALMPVSCMSVLLVYQQQKIGVLTIDNFKNEGFFTEDDLRFLEAIGSQIAISIVNARAFYEKQQRALQLETILDLHNQLNETVLEGNGVQSLVKNLARNPNDCIYYFDSLGRLDISYPTSNLENPFLSEWIRENQKKLHTQQLQKIYKEGELLGQALSVQSSFGTIGYLVITGKSVPLDIVGELSFQHAASIIAIEQIKLQEQLKNRQAEKEALLKDILNSHFTPEVQSYLKKQEMIPAKYFVFLVIKSKQHSFDELNQLNLLEEGMRQVFKKEFSVMIFPKRNKLFLLLGTKKEEAGNVQTVKQYIDRLQSIYKDILVYVGRPVYSMRHLSISYKDAELLEKEMDRIQREETVFDFQSLGYKRYLFSVQEEEAAYFIENILGPIHSQVNNRTKNEWLTTLQTYLQSNKNVAKTAELMHLHQNTVYYRLQQIQEKLNCDFDDLDNLTNLKIALFLHARQEQRMGGDEF
ncbi:helix-turn-helix domain-containing protein [Niallia sp.]|uniref:helix-turn-helix domain-containing protein n=1 Tax=Niallia sp. TaxID=2837523 RepID=UPI0028986811|nr:helix-turn-helix domain-containing protein [Niallia sp.]